MHNLWSCKTSHLSEVSSWLTVQKMCTIINKFVKQNAKRYLEFFKNDISFSWNKN